MAFNDELVELWIIWGYPSPYCGNIRHYPWQLRFGDRVFQWWGEIIRCMTQVVIPAGKHRSCPSTFGLIHCKSNFWSLKTNSSFLGVEVPDALDHLAFRSQHCQSSVACSASTGGLGTRCEWSVNRKKGVLQRFLHRYHAGKDVTCGVSRSKGGRRPDCAPVIHRKKARTSAVESCRDVMRRCKDSDCAELASIDYADSGKRTLETRRERRFASEWHLTTGPHWVEQCSWSMLICIPAIFDADVLEAPLCPKDQTEVEAGDASSGESANLRANLQANLQRLVWYAYLATCCIAPQKTNKSSFMTQEFMPRLFFLFNL